MIPDPSLSLAQGALAPWGKPKRSMRHHARATRFWRRCEKALKFEGISLRTPWQQLQTDQQQIILLGTEDFSGVIPSLKKLYNESESEYFRSELERFMTPRACSECGGARLKKESPVSYTHLTLPTTPYV